MTKPISWGSAAALSAAMLAAAAVGAHELDRNQVFADPTGEIETFNVNGRIDPQGAFFQDLGINGRNCSTCHQADQAMSISTRQIRQQFEQTRGRDPLFAAVDGANCSNAKTSDASAHSLLLSHGLIRIALPVPAPAQIQVSVVHDPYGCALVSDPSTGQLTLSTYRRPLPTTNLRFLSTMMFDYPGINDVLGADPDGIAFDSSSMTLFAAWENGGPKFSDDDDYGRGPFARRAARRDIAAGEVLFNTFPITISNVRGLNYSAALKNAVSFQGNCTTCHDAPNVGITRCLCRWILAPGIRRARAWKMTRMSPRASPSSMNRICRYSWSAVALIPSAADSLLRSIPPTRARA